MKITRDFSFDDDQLIREQLDNPITGHFVNEIRSSSYFNRMVDADDLIGYASYEMAVDDGTPSNHAVILPIYRGRDMSVFSFPDRMLNDVIRILISSNEIRKSVDVERSQQAKLGAILEMMCEKGFDMATIISVVGAIKNGVKVRLSLRDVHVIDSLSEDQQLSKAIRISVFDEHALSMSPVSPDLLMKPDIVAKLATIAEKSGIGLSEIGSTRSIPGKQDIPSYEDPFFRKPY